MSADDRVTRLRAAISLVGSAGADLGWGDRPEVRLLPDGRLWLTDLEQVVTAAEVYQAARNLIAAQLAGRAELSGEPVSAVVGHWLVGLQTNEAMMHLDLDLDLDRGLAEQDDAA